MNCTLTDYFCNPSAADLLEKIEDREVRSAKECHDLCMDEEGCKFFTFLKFRGTPSCYILKNCNEKVKLNSYEDKQMRIILETNVYGAWHLPQWREEL